jgi:hypothetical protein
MGSFDGYELSGLGIGKSICKVDGKPFTGLGSIKWSDGLHYHGMFKDGLRDGYGVSDQANYYVAKDKIIGCRANWKEGVPVHPSVQYFDRNGKLQELVNWPSQKDFRIGMCPSYLGHGTRLRS